MTDDEKREIKGRLLLEFQDAEDELAHLSEKARNEASNLRVLASFLDGARPPDTQTGPYVEKGLEYHATRLATIRRNCGYGDSLSFDVLLQLANELQRAEQRVRTLKKQKVELGLR
jgi:hypothetical protein